MSEIRIVEYDKTYAKAVADMWNASGENWGGENTIKTAEFVENDEKSSGNIKTFLGMDGDEVVGYCSFSNYKQDEGASYIPLLNVRPDYLGKKVGKMLLLRAVEEAIGAEWPRLDLYTWQGNEKAVPLYKKCGFFWEKRDDTTHLMNFLPYVMRTEAVSEYFEIIDWYKDSKREIAIDCDGKTEGEFDYFDYTWEKDNTNLYMEFERRGRGLSCIETNDYLIKARVDKQKLVMGMDYEIIYEVVNKSGKSLEVSFKGKTDKLINLTLDETVNVSEKELVRGSFYVDNSKEVQNKWKTHPCVSAEVMINGKKAEFRIGIEPKLPLEVKVGNFRKLSHIGINTLYIDIENGFDQEVTISSVLKNNKILNCIDNSISATIKAQEKLSIPVEIDLLEFGFYDELMKFEIILSDSIVNYETNLQGVFRGYLSKFYGEDKDQYYLFNGLITLTYYMKSNAVWINQLNGNNHLGVGVFMPQLGLPYFDEFSGKRPDFRRFATYADHETLTIIYESKKRSGLVMEWNVELYSEGIVKTFVEVINKNDSSFKEVYVKQKAMMLFENAYIPMNGNIVHVDNEDGLLPYMWDVKKLSENWVFSKPDNIGRGITWDKDFEVDYSHQMIRFESLLDELEGSKTYKTKNITLSLNSFHKYNDFREFAGYKDSNGLIEQDIHTSVNDNNAFVENGQLTVKTKENKAVKPEFNLRIASSSSSFDQVSEDITFVDNIGEVKIDYNLIPELDIVSLELENSSRYISRDKVLFFKSEEDMVTKEYDLENNKVYEISNGLITLKSSPDYGAGIYSMIYKNEEWLSHSFPKHSIKAWWNYWTGGIVTKPDELSNASVQEEDLSAEFVTLNDNKGNTWTGIKTRIDIVKNKELKGIKVDEYFMMMPGVPVMAKFAVVIQETNTYKDQMSVNCFGFIHRGESFSDNWVKLNNSNKADKYKCSDNEFMLSVSGIMTHGSKTSKYIMTRLYEETLQHEFENTNHTAYSYDGYRLNIENNGQAITEQTFYIFSQEMLDDESLKDLRDVYFEV